MSFTTILGIFIDVIGAGIIFAPEKRLEIWARNLKFFIGLVVAGIGGIIWVSQIIKDTYDYKTYNEIQLVDGNHYMQCINGIKVLISKSSTNSTIWLNLNGKPESCVTMTYTGIQIDLPENKNKHFISTN